MNKIKIVLADDHVVLRSGLKLMLNAQKDMEVIGETGDGEATLELLADLQPDVLLLDISMPGLDGLGVLNRMQAEFPKIRVLVLTMHDDEEYVKKVLSQGAKGYILKRAADVELLEAIRSVYRGEIYVDRALTDILVRQAFPERFAPKQESEPLTDREKEILQLVAMGYTNKQIAERLVISIKTVESHKAHVKEKLDLKGRAELVRYAVEHGLLTT